MNARKQGVVSGVKDGAERSLKASNSLRNAQAHQALRASLLAEKQELISHLQEELGQVNVFALLLQSKTLADEHIRHVRLTLLLT